MARKFRIQTQAYGAQRSVNVRAQSFFLVIFGDVENLGSHGFTVEASEARTVGCRSLLVSGLLYV
jgi:hypothetical protein